jgi:hypothetical protein
LALSELRLEVNKRRFHLDVEAEATAKQEHVCGLTMLIANGRLERQRPGVVCRRSKDARKGKLAAVSQTNARAGKCS